MTNYSLYLDDYFFHDFNFDELQFLTKYFSDEILFWRNAFHPYWLDLLFRMVTKHNFHSHPLRQTDPWTSIFTLRTDTDKNIRNVSKQLLFFTFINSIYYKNYYTEVLQIQSIGIDVKSQLLKHTIDLSSDRLPFWYECICFENSLRGFHQMDNFQKRIRNMQKQPHLKYLYL